jgi:hypothetical protein
MIDDHIRNTLPGRISSATLRCELKRAVCATHAVESFQLYETSMRNSPAGRQVQNKHHTQKSLCPIKPPVIDNGQSCKLPGGACVRHGVAFRRQPPARYTRKETATAAESYARVGAYLQMRRHPVMISHAERQAVARVLLLICRRVTATSGGRAKTRCHPAPILRMAMVWRSHSILPRVINV